MAQPSLDLVTQLEDASFVCSAHYLSCCGKCCVDFEYLNDEQESNNNNDTDDSTEDDSPKMAPMKIPVNGSSALSDARSSRPSTPLAPYNIGRFRPPNASDTPKTLFAPGYSPFRACRVPRLIRRSNPQELLIYTDGCCLDNGQQSPRAGCAFVYRSPTASSSGSVEFRLERQGPTGVEYPQTSNRAELRAVIAAITFRVWQGEGFTRLVIATDSDYVVSGITSWVDTWARNGWLTSKGTAVKNRDLWETLIKEVKHRGQDDYLGTDGLEVLFWHIPREQNIQADQMAKEAAASDDVQLHFTGIEGVNIGL